MKSGVKLCNAIFTICMLLIASSLSARDKTVYIKPFSIKQGIPVGSPLGSDVKDYISEVFVQKGDYALATDDEVREILKREEKRLLYERCTDEACMRKLMKSIKADLIIYGRVKKDAGKYYITAKMLERKESGVVRIRNSNYIRFRKGRYLEKASKALARYLINGDNDEIEDFYEKMKDKEEALLDRKSSHKRNLGSVDEAAQSRRLSLKRSPLVRIGYGSFGMVQAHDKVIRNYYDQGAAASLDVFVFREKDWVGDGVDLYLRGMYRRNKMSASGLETLQADLKAEPARVNSAGDSYLRNYAAEPDSPAEITEYGLDIALRFVGTAYFLREAWSFYAGVAARYLWFTEEYQSAQVTHEKKLSGWGIVGTAGLEVTIVSFLGVFGECNYGYVPLGNDEKNADGMTVLFGVTYRHFH